MIDYPKPTKTKWYLLLRTLCLPFLIVGLGLLVAVWTVPQNTIGKSTNFDGESGMSIHTPVGYIVVVGLPLF
jgi:hypothetical protein